MSFSLNGDSPYMYILFVGHEVAEDFNPHMRELQSRIQKTRENFNSNRADIHALMRRMLEVRNAVRNHRFPHVLYLVIHRDSLSF